MVNITFYNFIKNQMLTVIKIINLTLTVIDMITDTFFQVNIFIKFEISNHNSFRVT